jgi:hypothetical protein
MVEKAASDLIGRQEVFELSDLLKLRTSLCYNPGLDR